LKSQNAILIAIQLNEAVKNSECYE
jgi:hypothetical protein